MEEFFLRLLLAGDELNIVHQQQVGLTVLLAHLGGFALADGVDQFVGEIVALHVCDLGVGVVAADHIGDGVDQVGLTQTGVTVDQQGVVVLGGMLRDRLGGGVGQLVGRAHHEGLERELVRRKTVVLLFGGTAVECGKTGVVQNLDLKIRGEDIVQDRFDILLEQGFDIALFKIVGAVQDECVALDVHSRKFVEPGGNGSFRQIALQLDQYILPDIGDRIHKETPLIREKNTETAGKPETGFKGVRPEVCRGFCVSA